MTVREIRFSEIKTFKQCRRRWEWQYHRALEAPSTEAKTSDVGTLYHAGLQAHYSGTDPIAPIHAARDAHLAGLGDGALPKDWASAYELAEIMVLGYIEWLAETGADADYRVVGVERRIKVPFAEIDGDQVILTGQLDLEVEHVPTGLHYLRDHKSVQSLDQAIDQLQVDDQLLSYAMLIAMEDNTLVAGAEHNMARRVKRTATAKPPFYGRFQVNFNQTQLRNHHRHILGTLTEIVRAYQALEADNERHHDICPPSPSSSCSWICSVPSLPLCAMLDDGSGVEVFITDNLRKRVA